MKNIQLIFIFFLSICLFFNFGLVNANEKINEKKIIEFTKEVMKKSDINHLTIVVRKEGRYFEKNFYNNNKQSKKQKWFQIGSNSKALTALAINQLVEEKKIRLNSPIKNYLPYLKFSNNSKVTVGQLINHTSGIPFYEFSRIPLSDHKKDFKVFLKNSTINVDKSKINKFEYSSMNYALLGQLIEYRTSEDFNQYMDRVIHEQVESTSLESSPFEVEDKYSVTGHKYGLFRMNTTSSQIAAGNIPSAYMMINSKGLNEWIHFISNNKKYGIMLEESIKTKVSKELYYVNGWYFDVDTKEYFHRGDNPNFSSYIVFNKDENYGVGIISDTSSDYTEILGQGVTNILHNQSPPKANVIDINKLYDWIFITTSIFLILVFVIFSKNIINFIRKITLNNKLIINIALLSLALFVYIAPKIFIYNSISWEFLFEWLPISLILLVSILVFLLFTIFIKINFSKIKDEKNV